MGLGSGARWFSRTTTARYQPIGEDPEKAHEQAPRNRLATVVSFFRRPFWKRIWIIVGLGLLLLGLAHAADLTRTDAATNEQHSKENEKAPVKKPPPVATAPTASVISPQAQPPAAEPSPETPRSRPVPDMPHEPLTPGSRKLRIIAPADEPDVNLCKMLISTHATGYPAPIIVNWGRDFGKHKGGRPAGSSHLGKIDGTLEFLDAIASDKAPEDERLGEDDLVAVVDAYDVWFQLSPAVLISRYLQQNRRADERLWHSWEVDELWVPNTPKDTRKKPIAEAIRFPHQKIVMSTQARCWPDPEICRHFPESTLRPDLYGAATDKPVEDDFTNTRPRYPNSGSVIGPLRDMRRLFRRATEIVRDMRARQIAFTSDQMIFAMVLREQTLWRARRREQLSGGALAGEGATGEEFAKVETDRFEYGFGLDYEQELIPPTVFTEKNGEYVSLGNKTQLQTISLEKGVKPLRLKGVPHDLSDDAVVPLELAGLEPADGEGLGWGDVALYGDFFTAAVPVAVHHNGWRLEQNIDLKSQRLRDWWELMWFFPYLQDLFDGIGIAQVGNGTKLGVESPLARLPVSDGSNEALEYWAPRSDAKKPRPRVFSAEVFSEKGLMEAGWDELCQTHGRGPWRDEIFKTTLEKGQEKIQAAKKQKDKEAQQKQAQDAREAEKEREKEREGVSKATEETHRDNQAQGTNS